jgi:dolichol-phosphate mannosyltransferase
MAVSPKPLLSVVLPAYEEAANLDNLLPRLSAVALQIVSQTPRLPEALQAHEGAAGTAAGSPGSGPATQSQPARQFEIVVVDTPEPRDETPAICKKHGVRYVPRRSGSLYGHAIRTALEEASGEWVIFMDADGSHNPGFLPELWRYRNDFDLVIASRYVEGGKTENPAVLIFMSLVINIMFRITLGLKCMDVSNSFRLYRGDDLRKLRLKCNHFDIVEEILVKLITVHPSYRLKEVPFYFEKRKAGKTKRNLFTFALGYIATLARLMKLKREARTQNE